MHPFSHVLMITAMAAAWLVCGFAAGSETEGNFSPSAYWRATLPMLPVALLVLTVLQQLSRRHAWAGMLFRAAAAIIGFVPLVAAGYFSSFRMIDERSFTWWLLVAGGCAMAGYQARRAYLYVDQKWQAQYEKAFAYCLDPASGTLDVNSLPWKLQVEAKLFGPQSDKNRIRAGWATLALLVAVSRDVWELSLFFLFSYQRERSVRASLSFPVRSRSLPAGGQAQIDRDRDRQAIDAHVGPGARSGNPAQA